MASDLFLSNCSTEGDLAQLAQALLDNTASIRDKLLQDVVALSTSEVSSQIDVLNAMYDKHISPNKNDDIALQVGLPTANPDATEDESRLEPLGLVLVKQIVYSVGSDSNIENFRKLFFAVGSDSTLFLKLVRSTENLIVVQTRLKVKRLPASQQTWTLAEARSVLANDAIEAVYKAGDGAHYTVVPTFLAVNKSIKQTALELKVPENEIITQVFWLKEVQQNSAKINQLTAYGLGTDERSSVLTSESIKYLKPSTISNLRAQFDASVRKTLDQMELLNKRFSLIDMAAREVLRFEIQASITASKNLLLQLQQKIRFSPVLLESPEDIESFLTLNSEQDLSYLFSTKRSVTSIDFKVSRDELIKKIKSASAIPAGSSTVSSLLSNKPSSLDVDVDATNLASCLNECGSLSLAKRGILLWTDLKTSHKCIASTKIRPEIKEINLVPIIGYDSMDSAASILARRANLSATLKIDNIFKDVQLAADISSAVSKTSQSLSIAIKVLISMLKGAKAALDAVVKPLVSKIKEEVAKIEAFLSRHASFFATGSVDSSILKCALKLDLQFSLPFLADIAPFVEILSNSLKNLIGKVSKIISEALEKLICIPINFLNDLLKSATASYLPAFCKLDTFKLPADLEAALLELRSVYTVENVNFSNFSKNLIRVQASAEALNSKLDSFKEDLVCNQTPLNSRFMNTFRKDIDAGFGTNPLNEAASLLPVRG